MAGPSLISGLAGVVNAGGTQQGNSGPELLQIVQAVQQIQQQKKEGAKAELGTMLELMTKHGLAPDEKTFMKTAKDAGIPIESLTAAVSGNDAVKTGNAMQGNKQGAQSAFPVSDSAASKAPGGGVTKTTDSQGTQKAIAQSSPFDSMVARAQEKIQMQHGSEIDKLNLERLVTQLKTDAANGDSEAVGKLMNMGGIEFNMDQTMWNEASPDERKNMIGIAAGQESPAQKEQRLSQQATSLFSSGRYETLRDARDAAEGKQVKMLPNLGRIADEARAFNELFAATGDAKIAKEVGQKMANNVSLVDALPAGVAPVLQQQLDLQKRTSEAQIAGEKARTDIAYKGLDLQLKEANVRMGMLSRQVELDAKQLLLDLEKSKDEAFNKRFDNFVNLKRTGALPEEMETNMINELASRSGMTVQKVSAIWQWLGYIPGVYDYGEFEYKPDTSKDQGLLEEATRDSQKPADQLQGLMRTPRGGPSQDVANTVQDLAKRVKTPRGLQARDIGPRKGEMGR